MKQTIALWSKFTSVVIGAYQSLKEWFDPASEGGPYGREKNKQGSLEEFKGIQRSLWEKQFQNS